MALLSGLSSGVGDWDRVDEVVGGLFTSHMKLPEQLKKSSSNSVPKRNNNVTWKTALRVVKMFFLLLVDFFSFSSILQFELFSTKEDFQMSRGG